MVEWTSKGDGKTWGLLARASIGDGEPSVIKGTRMLVWEEWTWHGRVKQGGTAG